MAIDDVMILENNSVMYDEILAHRLGLIPITTDQSYNLPEECSCKSELGCEKCRAGFSLEIEAQEPVEVVYSSHLKPENPDVRPVSDRIPIVKLTRGQRVKLEAYARLGRGRLHAKWQPVSACTYSIDDKTKTFNFLVESTGTMPPEKLVLEAARMINAKTIGFEEQLSAISTTSSGGAEQ
jgi:DNA-directed RNA polymerase subunit D